MNSKPLLSIIIPTYEGSKGTVDITLESIINQKSGLDIIEIILAHNEGRFSKYFRKLSQQYRAKLIIVKGKPPQVCNQVNAAAKIANGEYIFILDHDVELEHDLLENFLKLQKKNKDIEAWYVPYKIMARGKILNSVRNFEEYFYKNSVVAAPRIIKRAVFWKTERQYDPMLSSGPADWDLANQLRVLNARFKYVSKYVVHHEEDLTFTSFVTKKSIYADGGEKYKKKWRNKNEYIYNNIVKKQYGFSYRMFFIFIEDRKWEYLLRNFHKYILFLALKMLVVVVYLINGRKYISK